MATPLPTRCPMCKNRALQPVEGIVLTAKLMGGKEISDVSVYRCGHRHLFAVFNQPVDGE
jgi:hypothetical protein